MAARRGIALIFLALALRAAMADEAPESLQLTGGAPADAPTLVLLPQPGVPIAVGPKDAVPALATARNTRTPAAPRPAGAPDDYKVQGADACLDAGAAKANTAAWLSCTNARNICGGPHPALIIKAKEGPAPNKPKPGAWVTLPQCSKAVFDACSEAAKAASTLLCSLELAAGYGRCSPKEFQEAHAATAADACVSAAADATGVEPRSGAWANMTQGGGAGGSGPARHEAGTKIDANASPFNNPYNNPFDNPYWAYYPYNRNGPIYGGNPYGGSPWGNNPWGYGYPPNTNPWPYTPNPGTPSNQYVNGQWYQFNGQWYQYWNGQWVPYTSNTGGGGGGSTTPPSGQGGGNGPIHESGPQYQENHWYQINGSWYYYSNKNWYTQKDSQWYMYSKNAWWFLYNGTYYYYADGKFFIPTDAAGTNGTWYYVPKPTATALPGGVPASPVPAPAPAPAPAGRPAAPVGRRRMLASEN